MRRCPACASAFEAEGWSCPRCGHAPGADGAVTLLAPEAIDVADGFDPAAFAALRETEERSFWFRSRNRLIAWAVQEHFPHARRILEIGCGTGYVMTGLREALPQAELTGAELYPAGLHHARERLPEADFVQLDATALPYEDHFDVIGAFDVLEHIDDDRRVLREMHRATRAGGGIAVTVPQHRWLWSAADDYARHRRRYRRAELVQAAEQAGFRVRRVTSFVSVLLPAMAASRLQERVRPAGGYDPTAEHERAERVGPALERVLDAEVALIKRGASLPAGGSLLLIAERMR